MGSEVTTEAYLQSYRGENLTRKSAQLRALRDAIQADGGRMMLVVWPLLYDFKTYPFQPIHDALADLQSRSTFR